MRILLIVNPSSGRGRAARLLPIVRDSLKTMDVTIVESLSLQHLIELASQATKDNYDIVCAVGGDGTIHYVMTGIMKALKELGTDTSSTALGIIPLGRGNDIARTLKIPTDPVAACQVLRQGKTKRIDLAYTGNHYYAGVAGVGFDAEATRLANETKLTGRGLPAAFIYIYAVLSILLRYQPKNVRIVHDQGTFEGRIMLAALSNGQAYGGGMMITPIAQVDDGLLDICIVREVSKLRLLLNFPQVFRGQHLSHPFVTYLHTRKAVVYADELMELYGDGEYLENTPLTIEIMPQCLPIIIP